MQLKLKDETVNINGLTLPMIEAIAGAMRVWDAAGMQTLVITSACDGDHMPGSKHYNGDALDLRSRTLTDAFAVRDMLQDELGDDYDVILESDHIHVEWDPIY